MKRLRVLSLFLLGIVLLVSAGCGRGGQGITPAYTRYEEGHWTLTDAMTAAENAEITESESKVSAVFAFPDGAVFTAESFWFAEKYYQGDSVLPEVNLIRTGEEPSGGEDVVCTLCFTDALSEDLAPAGEIRRSFSKDSSGHERLDSFSVRDGMTESTGFPDGEKFYIAPLGHFPEAPEGGWPDGQKMYIVLTADAGDRCARIAYEYTWAAEPETIEVPEQAGPIEYFP